MGKSWLFIGLCLAACHVGLLSGSEEPQQPFVAEDVVTEHTMEINGSSIKFRAVAGTLPLRDDKGKTKGSLFYVSYTRSDVESSRTRPIAFCFNGGPGSASIWLHMGILGPKRVLLSDLQANPPPYSYVDNPYSLLDVADLVFIDPISTGYSRSTADEDPKQFHGVEEDVKWVAEFVRLYLTRNSRWESPKFLIGESYGTLRAAAMAEYLHDEFYIYLNGIVLVSSILDFQTLDRFGQQDNDLVSILYLPSYTAAAWFHGKLAPYLQGDLTKALEEAKAFAVNEYSVALLKGDRLTANERHAIAVKVAHYSGLPVAFVEDANLRVGLFRYVKELLRGENRSIGRFDARYTGVEADRCGSYFEHDPSAAAIFGAFTAVFNQYVRQELKWASDENYHVLANVQPWNYGTNGNGYLSAAPALRNVMLRNPNLQVLVCNGYFDLATPFFASDYTFNHLNLDPGIAKNVAMTYYPAGHMMYTDPASLVAMSGDLKAFIARAVKSAITQEAASRSRNGQHP